jgi:hypothetical protein
MTPPTKPATPISRSVHTGVLQFRHGKDCDSAERKVPDCRGGVGEGFVVSETEDSGTRELRVALDGFGAHDGLEANKSTAIEIVNRICALRGSTIVEVRWARGESPIRVFLADNRRAVAAEIAYGFVWHPDHLNGAEPSKRRADAWFTPLPENRLRDDSTSVNEPENQLCPHCFVQVPVGMPCGLCDEVPN